MVPVTAVVGHEVDDDTVLVVAGIWARAVARRDGRNGPADVDAAVPGVRRRLAADGATLLVAHCDEGVVGFAAVGHRPLCAPDPGGLELFYLAVDPAAWGAGLGAALLAAADEHARATGRTCLELWVIDDNTRAIEVYLRAGWEPTDDVVGDPTSGRPERRLVRRLT